MKKLGSFMMAAVLASGIAVPVLAADAVNDATSAAANNGSTVHRTNNIGAGTGAGMNNAYGTRGVNGVNGANVNRYRADGTMGARSTTGYGTMNNNTTRAYADNDGMDWGWLGLIGLLGLAGMRGRERADR
jgi:hypothetical protein